MLSRHHRDDHDDRSRRIKESSLLEPETILTQPAIVHANFHFCCGTDTCVPPDLIEVDESLYTRDGFPSA